MNIDYVKPTATEHNYETLNRSLDENGYVVWPQLIPEHLIDAHLSGFEALMQNVTPEGAGVRGVVSTRIVLAEKLRLAALPSVEAEIG